MRTIAVWAAVCGAAFSAWPANVTIGDDGVLVVDGTRTFVLGLYENPKDDAVLKQARDAGFNLVRASADTAALDRLQAHGLFAWVNTGYPIDLSESSEERRAALRDLASRLGQHPALLVWEVPDEALWNCWYGAFLWLRRDEPKAQEEKIEALADSALAETLRADKARVRALLDDGYFAEAEQLADSIWRRLGTEPPHPDLKLSNAQERATKMAEGMRAGYALLKELDPAHPVWMNHAPRNSISQLAAFNEAADIVGCDIYPVTEYVTGHSDLAEKSLVAVGAYTDRMQAAAPGKPVWMVLQGFGWGDIQDIQDERERQAMKRPTFEQSRFMAYDAIVHGAPGLLYWGTAYIEKDSQLWNDLLQLATELRGIEHVLTAPKAEGRVQLYVHPTWGSVDRSVQVLAKDVDGKTWFILVNEWNEPLTCEVTYTQANRDGSARAALRDHFTGNEVPVEGGTFTTTLRGRGVQVLAPLP